MDNFIAKYMRCHSSEVPPYNAPRVEILRPIALELQSLQKLAIEARRAQMRSLINSEKFKYDAELRSTLGKSFVKDDVCDRRGCTGCGGLRDRRAL